MSRPFTARFAVVLAGEIVNKAAVTVAFLWIARVIDPGRYGEVEWALSVLMVATIAADAGLSTWGSSQVASRPQDAPAIAARIGGLRLLLAIPTYVLLIVVAMLFGGGAGRALAVYGVVLFFTPFFLQYLFNGLLETRWAALGQAVRGLTFAAAVVVLVRPGSPPAAVALAELLAVGALSLCNLLALRQALKIRVPLGAAFDGLRPVVTQSWMVGASELTWAVHWYAGLILLGYVATSTDAAWQSASLRLVMALHTGVWLYLWVLLPILSQRLTSDRAAWSAVVERSLRVTGWIGLGIALVGALSAESILTRVFGPAFAAAAPAFRTMIWAIPLAWMSGHLRYSLIAAGHARRETKAALVGAAATIGLTLLLAPGLRSFGAALAFLIGTIANAAAAWWLARGVLPAFSVWTSVSVSLMCTAACVLLGVMLAPATGEIPATLFAAIILAALALFMERDEARSFFPSLLRQRTSAAVADASGPATRHER
jgi:O-antigen/teichoic acid export membrane protein